MTEPTSPSTSNMNDLSVVDGLRMQKSNSLMTVKPKSISFTVFILWLIVQAVLFYKNGVSTVGEAETYIFEAKHLLAGRSLSSASYFLYLTQISLLTFALKSGIGYWFVAAVQLLFNLIATFAFYKLATHFFSTKVAIACIVLFLINYPLQELNFYLQTESLFFSFSIIYTAYLLQLSRLTLLHFFIILFSLALICVTRPTGLLFIPATFLYLFFGFLKTISTPLKLVAVGAISVVFLFVLNAALGSGGGLDFMLPFLDERIICGVPTLDHNVNIKTASNGNSVYGLLYYITHNFQQFIRLALLRSQAFFGLLRTYFGIGHNIFLASFFYPFYVFTLLSIRWWLKNNLYPFLYLLSLILFTLGTTMLTCDDWHNRWFLSISPWLIFLSLPTINKLFTIFTAYGGKRNIQQSDLQ